jgi:hypothetical protein
MTIPTSAAHLFIRVSHRIMRGACAFAVCCLSFLLSACGGSDGSEAGEAAADVPPAAAYRYAPVAPMTDVPLETAAKDLRVLCPRGWKETVDQKNAPNIVLWLVRDDYQASISFAPMQMNPALYKTLKKDGIMAVAKVSLSMHKDQARDSVVVLRPPERFRLDARECVAYEYTVDKGATVIRIVIFDTGRQFMECALLPATPAIPPDENRRLFETQQSVLASMRAQ